MFKISIFEAIEKHSIQAVVTAIETNGCWGNDKYFRLKNTEEIKTTALKLLAEFCEETKNFCDYLDSKDDRQEISFDYNRLDFLDRFDREFKKYGWFDGSIPAFNDSNPDHSVMRRAEFDHPRRVNTTYIIIAALLDYSAIELSAPNIADLLEDLTIGIGVPVGDQTIKDILAEIPPLLEKRRKSTKKT